MWHDSVPTFAHAKSEDGTPPGYKEFWIAIPIATVLAIFAIDGLFDQFNFCPICGGDGKIRQITKSPWTGAMTCPLLLLKADWHGGGFA